MAGYDAEFTAFVQARSPSLLRSAHLMCGDRQLAEDLVQTALTKTYAAWPRMRHTGAAEAYCRRALMTSHVSWWRRLANQRESVTTTGQLPTSPDTHPRQHAETYADRDFLVTALAQLPARQRAVLVLRYFHDLPDAEIATTLNLAVGTVKSHGARGLAHLRRIVTDQSAERDSEPHALTSKTTPRGNR